MTYLVDWFVETPLFDVVSTGFADEAVVGAGEGA